METRAEYIVITMLENLSAWSLAASYSILLTTVEPRLSGPPLSGTSIIRLVSFFIIRFNNSENGRVP